MHKTSVLSLISAVIAFAIASPAFGAMTSEPIPLWPKGGPNEKGDVGEEQLAWASSHPPVGRE